MCVETVWNIRGLEKEQRNKKKIVQFLNLKAKLLTSLLRVHCNLDRSLHFVKILKNLHNVHRLSHVLAILALLLKITSPFCLQMAGKNSVESINEPRRDLQKHLHLISSLTARLYLPRYSCRSKSLGLPLGAEL